MLDTLKSTWLHENQDSLVFEYRVLRMLIGMIAIVLPFIVTHFSGQDNLTSISVSYYSDARDYFVGALFVVGAFLLAYRGHYFYEGIASLIASISAFFVAIAPTRCDVSISANRRTDPMILISFGFAWFIAGLPFNSVKSK